MIPLTTGAFLLEKRQYDENATPEEIEAIKGRVYIFEERIAIYDEVPVISTFTARVMLTRLLELVEEHDIKAVLFDVERAKPPSFRIRNVIFEFMTPIINHADIVCFTSGKNKLLNIAVQFFLNSAKYPGDKIQINSSKEESLQKIYDCIKRQ